MAGKYLGPAAVADTLRSERAANARRRRAGLTRHPIRAISCRCPAPGCGAFHLLDTGRTIPTAAECRALLAAHNRVKKASR